MLHFFQNTKNLRISTYLDTPITNIVVSTINFCFCRSYNPKRGWTNCPARTIPLSHAKFRQARDAEGAPNRENVYFCEHRYILTDLGQIAYKKTWGRHRQEPTTRTGAPTIICS